MTTRLIRTARLTRRLVAVAGGTAVHMARCPNSGPSVARARVAHTWGSAMARAVGIEVVRTGDEPPPGTLLVANHRSYVDIIAVLAQVPCVFLAKAELARWPLFGPAAARAGTVFVQRERRASRRSAGRRIADITRAGARVLVFPEGTTTAAPARGDYRPGIFVTAAEHGLPVVPVAIEYGAVADAWVGHDTFVRHFAERFAEPTMRVRIAFGSAIRSSDASDLQTRISTWTDDTLAGLRRALGGHDEGAEHLSREGLPPARPVDGRSSHRAAGGRVARGR